MVNPHAAFTKQSSHCSSTSTTISTTAHGLQRGEQNDEVQRESPMLDLVTCRYSEQNEEVQRESPMLDLVTCRYSEQNEEVQRESPMLDLVKCRYSQQVHSHFSRLSILTL